MEHRVKTVSIFRHGRAAIVTEIYLPQKYARSLEAQEALRDSLLPAKIRHHFETTGERAIRRVLPRELRKRYAEFRAKVIKTRRSFSGYTIYDVAGTFRETQKPVEYDASACIRIIDWPSEDELFKRLKHCPSHELFQQVARTVFALRQHHGDLSQLLATSKADRKSIAQIHTKLDDWIDQGSFLLYGFLLAHLLRVTRGREKAVLMTSHFAVVNQYETPSH